MRSVAEVRSVENEECAKCGVCTMRSVQNAVYIREKDIKIYKSGFMNLLTITIFHLDFTTP